MMNNALQCSKVHRIKTAAILGISRSGIYRHVRAGELVLIKIGRGYNGAAAITEDSIREFIAKRTVCGW